MLTRIGALPVGLAVTTVVQLLSAATQVSPVVSIVGSIVVGWAVYLLVILRDPDTRRR